MKHFSKNPATTMQVREKYFVDTTHKCSHSTSVKMHVS